MSVQAEDWIPWPAELAEGYRRRGLWLDHSLQEEIFQQLIKRPDACALIDGARRWSYSELFAQAQALSSEFQQRKISNGRYVVLHLPNCAEFFVILIACWMSGAVPILAVAAHRQQEVNAYLEQSQSVAYFGSDSAFAQSLESAIPLASFVIEPTQSNSILLRQINGTSGEIRIDAPQRLPPRHTLEFCCQAPCNLALLQLSGGSTGTPKLIPRTHNDYLYSIRQSIARCRIGAHSRYLAVLPLGHNFCLSSPGTLGILMSGGTVVIAQSSQASLAFTQIKEQEINCSALVPSIARMWATYAQAQESAPSNLKDLWIGGAPLDPQSAQFIEESLGSKVLQVYGMAEGLVCFTDPDAPTQVRWHCQGTPLSEHDQIRIVDAEGQDCALGQQGEVWTQGPYTIRGYFRSPEHNLRSFSEQGFYKTGDLARMRPDGNIEVMGRKKQQINRGGEKIASIEVEALLRLHPKVKDAALVGLPDPVLGEQSCAVVVWEGTENAKEIGLALRRFLRAQRIAHFKIPDRIERQHSLPKSPIGKVDRKEVRARLLNTP